MRVYLHLTLLIINAYLGYSACYQTVIKQSAPLTRLSNNWYRKNLVIPVPNLIIL